MSNRRQQAQNKLARVGLGKPLSRLDPLATAFHEAGHCVFSEAFGITVEWATCFPHVHKGVRNLGFVHTDADKVMLPANLLLIEGAAGDIAEWRLISTEPYKAELISSSDVENVVPILQQICTANEQALDCFRTLAQEAHELVKKADRWIRALGVELYVRKKMQGDEIREILRRNNFYQDNPLIKFAQESVATGRRIVQFQEMRQQLVSQYSEEMVKKVEQEFADYFETLNDEQKTELQKWSQNPETLNYFKARMPALTPSVVDSSASGRVVVEAASF